MNWLAMEAFPASPLCSAANSGVESASRIELGWAPIGAGFGVPAGSARVRVNVSHSVHGTVQVASAQLVQEVPDEEPKEDEKMDGGEGKEERAEEKKEEAKEEAKEPSRRRRSASTRRRPSRSNLVSRG